MLGFGNIVILLQTYKQLHPPFWIENCIRLPQCLLSKLDPSCSAQLTDSSQADKVTEQAEGRQTLCFCGWMIVEDSADGSRCFFRLCSMSNYPPVETLIVNYRFCCCCITVLTEYNGDDNVHSLITRPIFSANGWSQFYYWLATDNHIRSKSTLSKQHTKTFVFKSIHLLLYYSLQHWFWPVRYGAP